MSEPAWLSGEVALVTGGADGIGRGIAAELHRAGAQVVIADVDPSRGEALAAALGGPPTGARFVATDLARPHAPDALVDAVLAAFGRLDMLVHCASPVRHEADTLFAVRDETWDAVLQVNLGAGFRLGRRVAREMLRAGTRGRLLFITSLHAETPRNLVHYSAAKGGLQMVVRDLARTLASHGIRVNAIAPGAILTGGMTPPPDLAAKIPLGRLGRPADIAPTALALLVDRSSAYVTGATIVVDGGPALYTWIPAPPGRGRGHHYALVSRPARGRTPRRPRPDTRRCSR